MTMKIRFGLHLDGQHGRDAINQLGASDVGPLSLLTIMETQLELVSPQAPAATGVSGVAPERGVQESGKGIKKSAI
jgi:hypothetical protein